MRQLITQQSRLRPDVPPALIRTIRFSDNIYIEHTADLVRGAVPGLPGYSKMSSSASRIKNLQKDMKLAPKWKWAMEKGDTFHGAHVFLMYRQYPLHIPIFRLSIFQYILEQRYFCMSSAHCLHLHFALVCENVLHLILNICNKSWRAWTVFELAQFSAKPVTLVVHVLLYL